MVSLHKVAGRYDFISHSSVPSAAGCGGNFTAPSGGPVTYPGDYGTSETCEWTITVPEGSIIRLTFDYLYTRSGDDFLTIYDGASANATVVQRFTGSPRKHPIISTSNAMFLRFTSDDDLSGESSFQFSYNSQAGQCWDPGVPANGNRDRSSNFTSGQTVRYSCTTGYQLFGAAAITCQSNGTWSDAIPSCADSIRIRLVESDYQGHGLVEVRPADSLDWGRVCYNHFDVRDADVVCRMLGYIWANQVYNRYGGDKRTYLDDIQCDGSESSLFNCSHAGWGNCGSNEHAGVICGTLKCFH
ncbi:CUB and sushi domain-containing protein 1-like [Branchiostoma floridae x Branchiostoma belcheri]